LPPLFRYSIASCCFHCWAISLIFSAFLASHFGAYTEYFLFDIAAAGLFLRWPLAATPFSHFLRCFILSLLSFFSLPLAFAADIFAFFALDAAFSLLHFIISLSDISHYATPAFSMFALAFSRHYIISFFDTLFQYYASSFRFSLAITLYFLRRIDIFIGFHFHYYYRFSSWIFSSFFRRLAASPYAIDGWFFITPPPLFSLLIFSLFSFSIRHYFRLFFAISIRHWLFLLTPLLIAFDIFAFHIIFFFHYCHFIVFFAIFFSFFHLFIFRCCCLLFHCWYCFQFLFIFSILPRFHCRLIFLLITAFFLHVAGHSIDAGYAIFHAITDTPSYWFSFYFHCFSLSVSAFCRWRHFWYFFFFIGFSFSFLLFMPCHYCLFFIYCYFFILFSLCLPLPLILIIIFRADYFSLPYFMPFSLMSHYAMPLSATPFVYFSLRCLSFDIFADVFSTRVFFAMPFFAIAAAASPPAPFRYFASFSLLPIADTPPFTLRRHYAIAFISCLLPLLLIIFHYARAPWCRFHVILPFADYAITIFRFDFSYFIISFAIIIADISLLLLLLLHFHSPFFRHFAIIFTLLFISPLFIIFHYYHYWCHCRHFAISPLAAFTLPPFFAISLRRHFRRRHFLFRHFAFIFTLCFRYFRHYFRHDAAIYYFSLLLTLFSYYYYSFYCFLISLFDLLFFAFSPKIFSPLRFHAIFHYASLFSFTCRWCFHYFIAFFIFFYFHIFRWLIIFAISFSFFAITYTLIFIFAAILLPLPLFSPYFFCFIAAITPYFSPISLITLLFHFHYFLFISRLPFITFSFQLYFHCHSSPWSFCCRLFISLFRRFFLSPLPPFLSLIFHYYFITTLFRAAFIIFSHYLAMPSFSLPIFIIFRCRFSPFIIFFITLILLFRCHADAFQTLSYLLLFWFSSSIEPLLHCWFSLKIRRDITLRFDYIFHYYAMPLFSLFITFAYSSSTPLIDCFSLLFRGFDYFATPRLRHDYADERRHYCRHYCDSAAADYYYFSLLFRRRRFHYYYAYYFAIFFSFDDYFRSIIFAWCRFCRFDFRFFSLHCHYAIVFLRHFAAIDIAFAIILLPHYCFFASIFCHYYWCRDADMFSFLHFRHVCFHFLIIFDWLALLLRHYYELIYYAIVYCALFVFAAIDAAFAITIIDFIDYIISFLRRCRHFITIVYFHYAIFAAIFSFHFLRFHFINTPCCRLLSPFLFSLSFFIISTLIAAFHFHYYFHFIIFIFHFHYATPLFAAHAIDYFHCRHWYCHFHFRRHYAISFSISFFDIIAAIFIIFTLLSFIAFSAIVFILFFAIFIFIAYFRYFLHYFHYFLWDYTHERHFFMTAEATQLTGCHFQPFCRQLSALLPPPRRFHCLSFSFSLFASSFSIFAICFHYAAAPLPFSFFFILRLIFLIFHCFVFHFRRFRFINIFAIFHYFDISFFFITPRLRFISHYALLFS